MSIKDILSSRTAVCELCAAEAELEVYKIPPVKEPTADNCILLCANCMGQVEDPSAVDVNHWRCLNDSMWSSVPAVQVMSWRMLDRLRGEGWPIDLLDMLYLDDETMAWAKADSTNDPKHRDSNGQELVQGDNVVLIKNLEVKGANFTAKRGTAVRRITLVKDNVAHIEGRVNGQQIVILTEFVKKTS